MQSPNRLVFILPRLDPGSLAILVVAQWQCIGAYRSPWFESLRDSFYSVGKICLTLNSTKGIIISDGTKTGKKPKYFILIEREQKEIAFEDLVKTGIFLKNFFPPNFGKVEILSDCWFIAQYFFEWSHIIKNICSRYRDNDCLLNNYDFQNRFEDI